MTIDRRKVLAGITGLATSASMPAWAQFGNAIQPQSDPWAQVDPYADPRNGFPSQRPQASQPGNSPRNDVFDRRVGRGELDDPGEIASAKAALERGVAEAGGRHPDNRIQQAMQTFIQPLAKASDTPQLPWEAIVSRTEDINAWTVGGGKMCYFAGLIRMCDHPWELAAVVAHEMGHVDKGHSLETSRMIKAAIAAEAAGVDMKLNIPAHLLVEGDVPAGVNDAFDLLIAGYTREKEYEADEHSLVILERAGIHPSAGILLMQKFIKLDMATGSHRFSTLVIDHPHSKDRLANMVQKIGMQTNPPKVVTLPGWDVLKAAFPTPPFWRSS